MNEKHKRQGHCPKWKESPYMQGREIVPVHWKKGSTIEDIISNLEATCFEARNVAAGARLFEYMIKQGDTIWMGVAGAGPVGGMGGYIIDLIKAGFVDVLCSTGAQVYHDGHFAFGLPVVQGSPRVDDNALDADGTTRIYDINIRMDETLKSQDDVFKEFAKTLSCEVRSTADYVHEWGEYIRRKAPHAEHSWVATAAEYGVPIFLDSESNHSIGMNNAALFLEEGKDIAPNASRSLLEGAALVYSSPQLGFFEWGGGGPKNWIQTLAPMISQIIGVDFEGADRGIQITTAFERDGGLSGCTFGEAVTWGKYKDATKGLVQVWGEYSVIAPLLVGYVIEKCETRAPKRLMDHKNEYMRRLYEAWDQQQAQEAWEQQQARKGLRE
ncbi:deoxyhypusine synthase family protein [Candidatus Woesearchaeota archaeon]|nr:deoxyhypusine synthase family protein [Candidatus Woesearchaeota archaeon]